MKTKLLIFLLAIGALALAAWLVHRNDGPAADADLQINRAHGAQIEKPKPDQSDAVPEKYRETVRKGLEFLAKNQHMDGHWEGEGGKHPVAMTALVGMALLMEGSDLEKGKYSANIGKAVNWLMDKAQAGRDGLIFSGHPSETDCYMYGHGLATQFLAWTQREPDAERAKKIKEILTGAVKYIEKAQSTQGGWYKTSKVEGHDLAMISTTAIQIQALYITGNFGFPVRSEAVAASGQEYLKQTLAKQEEGSKAGAKRRQPADLAAALACRVCPDAYLDNDGLYAQWAKACRTEIPMGRDIKFGRDELTHYYYAQALFTLKVNPEFKAASEAATWNAYCSAMFDHLKSSQNKDGSWPAPVNAEPGISVGPVYATAIWCTVLQLDKRSHPLTRQQILHTF